MSSSPVLVHTDLTRLDRKTFKGLRSSSEITEAAISYLNELTKNRDLWLPTFNYSFPETKKFDVQRDACEVGIINETLRNSGSFVRSEIPVFSLIRNHSAAKKINEENILVEPFGPEGEFAELFDANGEIMFFGAKINSLTQIHRIEEAAGIKYRYYKIFKGEVHNDMEYKKVDLKFKVRPKGLNLQYNWDKLYLEIDKAGIINIHGCNIFSFRVVDLHNFLLQKLQTDELWMLTDESKSNVFEARRAIGRDYDLGDFE